MKKYFLLFLILSLTLTAGFQAEAVSKKNNVDAVTGASLINHYVASSLTGSRLIEIIKKKDAAFVLSTTNPDGSPNAAVFIPGVVSDSVLKFGMAKNQTRLNIERTEQAVLTVYCLNLDKKNNERHSGARLILKLIKGKKVSEKKNYSILKMEIERVLPLG